jgi:anaerobic dimethyl sulfoxide reductase subunit C (anchor subunit)
MNLREWALPVYTILMQLSVGSMAVLWTLRSFFRRRYSDEQIENALRNPVAVVFITISVAMIGSFFHLSQWYISFMAIVNIDTSWLSREVFFTVLCWLAVTSLWYIQAHIDAHMKLKTLLGWLAVGFGLTAIFCMSNCYQLPSQAAWDTPITYGFFYSSVILLGISASVTIFTMDLQIAGLQKPAHARISPEIIRRSLPVLAGVAIMIMLSVILQYHLLIQHLSAGDLTAETSVQLYTGLYQPLLIFRLAAGLIGVIWLGIAGLQVWRRKLPVLNLGRHAYMACLLIMVGEIVGRFLFYATHVRIGI